MSRPIANYEKTAEARRRRREHLAQPLSDREIDRIEAFWVGAGEAYDDLRRVFIEVRLWRAGGRGIEL